MNKEQLTQALKERVCEVKFLKTNGEKRLMKATLKEDLLPVVEVDPDKPKKERKKNPDVQPVFDTEKKAWRSFRYDAIISVDGKMFEMETEKEEEE